MIATIMIVYNFEGFFLAWVDCKQSVRTVKLKVLSEAENGKRLFFLMPQRACEARTLLARETLRLLTLPNS